jgi:hypothetical protein
MSKRARHNAGPFFFCFAEVQPSGKSYVDRVIASPRTAPIVIALLALLVAPSRAQSVPLHVETWAGYHYGGVNEGAASPPSTIRKWVTYLDGGWPFNRNVCDVPGHPCLTVDYINASNEYFGQCGYSEAVAAGGLKQQGTLAESAWLHVKPPPTYANRIFNNLYSRCTPASPNTGLFINKKSRTGAGNALTFFNSFMLRKYGGRWPDYLMNDDITVYNNLWPTGHAAYEYSSWVDVTNAQAAFLGGEVNDKRLPQPLFFNGCGNNPAAVTGVSLIKMRPNIVGCITENNTGKDAIRNGRVVYSLDNCARVTLSAHGGIFVNGPDGDPGAIARRQATAFNMLCYVPRREVFWEEPQFGSKFVNVFPEQGIYPMRPLQSMRIPSRCPEEEIALDGPGIAYSSNPCAVHGHNDLLVAGAQNVFRREFSQCYNQGVAVGQCAVIWNVNDKPVTMLEGWLKQRYSRTMTMNGGTIDERGTVAFRRFEARGYTIPAYDALFLFQ